MRNRTKALGQAHFLAAVFVGMLALFLSSSALYERTADAQAVEDTSLTDAFKAVVADELQYSPDAMAKLTANDGIPRGNFGFNVAISGDTAIIGATNLPEANGGSIPGAAYIFVRNGAAWAFQQKLTAPDAPAGNGNAFGDTVAISGDTAVVAAPQHDSPEAYSGGAYVYVRNGTSWSLQKRFTNADTPLVKGGKIGYGVAVSGDTVLVTGFGFMQSTPHRDFVHVFVREGTAWTLQSTLITGGDDSFDARVAISGDTAVIGEANRSGTRQNAVHIYVRCGTEWTQQQRLTSSGPQFNDFGNSVGISGNTVIIGARSDQIGQNQTGSAYIFVSDGTTWTQQAKLTGTVNRLNFGHSVAILGDTAVVGAPNGTFAGGTQAGGAEVFVRSGTSWSRESTITSPDGQPSDGFGSGVAISPDTIIVGAPYDDLGSTQTNEGSAWAIDRVTAAPPPASSPCDEDIEVNITTDEPDADLEDDLCDVNVNQSGLQCSLRAAIQTANAKEGPDEIKFNIPGGGVQTISPATNLPAITEQVTIDGTSQPGYSNAAPMIELAGSLVSDIGRGLVLGPGSDASTVKALTINRFGSAIGVGVEFRSNNNVLEGCYIGLSSDGLSAFGNGATLSQQIGVSISGSGNRIGGMRVDRPSNYIAGNGITQIEITSASATGNTILGNDIGALVNGDIIPESVSAYGVKIDAGASGNTVGGTTMNDINDITGILAGVLVTGVSNTTITKNLIQFCGVGVWVAGASNTTIGGDTSAGIRNVFDRNLEGIRIQRLEGKSVSGSTKVFGNLFKFVALDTTPVEPVVGINVVDAQDTLIGNGQQATTNFFCDCENTAIGVQKEAVRTVIDLNYIGFDNLGGSCSNYEGIRLAGDGTSVRRNIISNNEIGVAVNRIEPVDPAPTDNTIADNRIGLGINGTGFSPNNTGILIEGEENTLTGNLVSGNSIAGIDVRGDRNTISQNRVGTNATGNAAIANLAGIIVSGSGNSILGNTVSGNTVGITISPFQDDTIPTGNKIKGNFIGTNSTGNSPVPNTLDGILISNSRTTLIGGLGPDIPTDRNIISGNGRHGIALSDGATQNRISGNYIGVATDGTTSLGNIGNGIRVGDSVSNTTIGGPEENSGNTIGYNGVNGIALANDAGNNNLIDPNRIFGNVLAGIDIGENGFTLNDPTDADSGPNNLQNYPTFTLAIVGGDLIVIYQVDSAPQHSTYGTNGIYVEFFEADATGAGRDFLGFDHFLLSDYNNGTPGTREKNLGNAAALGVTSGDRITATATDAEGNSSEFTPAVPLSSSPVTISGRVTTPSGLGLRNAIVTLVEPSGVRRTATTSSFGIYSFANVPAGQSYTISVSSKRYRFAPRIQTIDQNLNNLDFVGLE